MAKKPGGTPATSALIRAQVPFQLHPYTHDPQAQSYGLEAAEALGVDANRVFKTLFARLDGELVVGIVPVTKQLDLKSCAKALRGRKATMAAPADAERASGYVVGGISPIGQKRRHRTALDHSAMEFATIYVSAGRRGLDVELAPDDLLRLTEAVTAPLSSS